MTSLLRRRQHRGQPFGRVSGSAAVSGDRTARRSRPPGYRLRNRMKDQAEEHMWIMKAARTPSTCARESKGRCNRVPLTKGPGHSGECEKPVALASEAATSGRFSLLWFLLEKAETLEYWPITRMRKSSQSTKGERGSIRNLARRMEFEPPRLRLTGLATG